MRYAELSTWIRSPVKTLAAELDLTPAVTRNVAYDARKKGFLTPATAGQAAGDPTPKAL